LFTELPRLEWNYLEKLAFVDINRVNNETNKPQVAIENNCGWVGSFFFPFVWFHACWEIHTGLLRDFCGILEGFGLVLELFQDFR